MYFLPDEILQEELNELPQPVQFTMVELIRRKVGWRHHEETAIQVYEVPTSSSQTAKCRGLSRQRNLWHIHLGCRGLEIRASTHDEEAALDWYVALTEFKYQLESETAPGSFWHNEFSASLIRKCMEHAFELEPELRMFLPFSY